MSSPARSTRSTPTTSLAKQARAAMAAPVSAAPASAAPASAAPVSAAPVSAAPVSAATGSAATGSAAPGSAAAPAANAPRVTAPAANTPAANTPAANAPAANTARLRVVAKTHEAPRKEVLGKGVLTGEQITVELPDPEPLLRNLGRSVFEAMAGVREVEQMARWIAPEVYSGILARVQHATRARRIRGKSVRRPMIETRTCLWQSPRPGVVEATVLVDLGARVRAVVIRLEAFRGRWRAERLHVL